ncbi:SVM family protein [Candidatus Phytoplasma meliae]|uniref:SVM family protein n=1 Tax=Candidatus Phytoplasma meliae TaxID=1848402 RepID=A0ABS5CYQ7_9MOLU|nr:SVM family protein [Candidatus Phytoplasma meliae]MBP5836110.1 SVM family protein [Candidatus Phytoplasma meliae]
MLKLKKQFNIIYLCLIIFIGTLFPINNHRVMAMHNQDNITNEKTKNNEAPTNKELQQPNVFKLFIEKIIIKLTFIKIEVNF